MFKKLVIPMMVGLLALGVTTYAGISGSLPSSGEALDAGPAQSPLATPMGPSGGGEPPGGPPGGGEPGSEEPGGRGERPDLAAAAKALGVTEDALKEALGDPADGPPDLAGAAQALGVTEDELKEALGPPPGGSHGGGDRPPSGKAPDGGEGPGGGERPPGGPSGGEGPPSGEGPPDGPPPEE